MPLDGRRKLTLGKYLLLAIALSVFGGAAWLNYREAEARRDRRDPFEEQATAYLEEFKAKAADADYQRRMAEGLVKRRHAQGDKAYKVEDAHVTLKVLLNSLQEPRTYEATKDHLVQTLIAKKREAERQTSADEAKKPAPTQTFAEVLQEMAVRAQQDR